ncbi:MAG: hypothetical protein JW722_01050 [Demequinaceae bacterium]|nr:hypothetical protein [Demequinaceae bacterium]
MTTETPAAPEHRPFLRRLAVWSGRLGALALIGASVYLTAMAVMWHLHIKELEEAERDLSGQLADSETALADVTSTLEAARQELDDTLTSIVDSANIKAQAQDNQLLFEDIATVMADCANEADILVGYTYDRALYTYASLKSYENSVRDYCREVSTALRELIAETEGEGS